MVDEIKDFYDEHKKEIVCVAAATTAAALFGRHMYKKGVNYGGNDALNSLYKVAKKHGSLRVSNTKGNEKFYVLNSRTYNYTRNLEKELKKIKAQ